MIPLLVLLWPLLLLLAALGGASVLSGWLIALCLDERDHRRAAGRTPTTAIRGDRVSG